MKAAWITPSPSLGVQTTTITLGTSGNPTSVLNLTYSYGTTDNNGSLKSHVNTIGSLAITDTFSYDSLNRISSTVETTTSGSGWTENNGYDRYGNRWIDLGGGNQSLYCNTSDNRITGWSYDASGDLLNDGVNSYSYDAEGHIKTVNATTAYVYDGGGARVRKFVGENTRFIYGLGGELIAEFDGTNGSLKKEYVYGGGTVATIEPTAVDSNGTQYSTADSLGSPRVITNSSASVVSRHDYLPFGEELGAGVGGRTTGMGFSNSGDNNRKKFTGYERDTETGLDFAQARYYANTQGRFTSPDVLSGSTANPQTLNRYAYVANNPINLTDTTGMMIDASQDWESVGAQVRARDPRGPKTIASEDNSAAEAGFDWGVSDAYNAAPSNEESKADEATGGDDGKASEPQNPDASGNNGNPGDIAADNALGALFTDGTGIVRGVSSIRNVADKDTYYSLADGTVHTFHVYGDANATTRTGLYIPAAFSQIEWVGASTVVATNPRTGEVLNCYHVLRTGHQGPNAKGSRYIGQIGGAGATRPGDIHAHITLFKDRASRDAAESWRMEPTKVIVNNTPGFPRDLNSSQATRVRDIRSLIK